MIVLDANVISEVMKPQPVPAKLALVVKTPPLPIFSLQSPQELGGAQPTLHNVVERQRRSAS